MHNSRKTILKFLISNKKGEVRAYQPFPIIVKLKLKLDMPEIVDETLSVRPIVST